MALDELKKKEIQKGPLWSIVGRKKQVSDGRGRLRPKFEFDDIIFVGYVHKWGWVMREDK